MNAPDAAPPKTVSPPALTEPVEDYLKAIYELESRFGAAATSDVANALDVAPASVTGMVRRLATQGFLDHVPYRGVQLTPRGRQAALRTIRRHRILVQKESETLLIQRELGNWIFLGCFHIQLFGHSYCGCFQLTQ
jgi:Mn-dependent DtxR family transcriptional regulator